MSSSRVKSIISTSESSVRLPLNENEEVEVTGEGGGALMPHSRIFCANEEAVGWRMSRRSGLEEMLSEIYPLSIRGSPRLNASKLS